MGKNDLRTVFNLKADPDDFSPVTDHIVTTVREALAADQRVIVLAGEEHATIAAVRFAETLRGALHAAGIQKTAIAREQEHNFLEMCLADYYLNTQGADQAVFRRQVLDALSRIKEEDAPRYRRLQALSYAAWDWPLAPLAKHENFKTWLENNVPVHLIDAATFYHWTGKAFLDSADSETKKIMERYIAVSNRPIDAESPEGMHIRNRFMAAKMKTIMAASDAPSVLIVQAGMAHLGGDQEGGNPYVESLCHILTEDKSAKNIRILPVFPEMDDYTYETILSSPAQAVMNNADTIVLKNASQAMHATGYRIGSFKAETATLAALFERSDRAGVPPALKNRAAYQKSLAAMKNRLTTEIKDIIAHYIPG